jgi:hypothetical protein
MEVFIVLYTTIGQCIMSKKQILYWGHHRFSNNQSWSDGGLCRQLDANVFLLGNKATRNVHLKNYSTNIPQYFHLKLVCGAWVENIVCYIHFNDYMF